MHDKSIKKMDCLKVVKLTRLSLEGSLRHSVTCYRQLALGNEHLVQSYTTRYSTRYGFLRGMESFSIIKILMLNPPLMQLIV
jgi:hypothetical protein